MTISISVPTYDREDARTLAHLSDAAYQGGQNEINAYLQKLGLPPVNAVFTGSDDTLAFALITSKEIVLSFRGTEPRDWKNWRTDFDADHKAWARNPEYGQVHDGFQRALNTVMPAITTWLRDNNPANLPVVTCGHSLGGALAILAAVGLGDAVTQVYTFGQPRVGDRTFAASIDARTFASNYFRFVNDQDIVPHVAPYTLNYGHGGRQVHFDGSGWSVSPVREESLEDALKELTMLLGRQLDGPIEDHFMEHYLKALG